MKVKQIDRDVTFQGITGVQAPFAISQTNQSHVMAILREGLYSDRYLAVLREYASNAWDSHISAGLSSTPIKVTLPTPQSLILSIRDYGLGLSETDMMEVFTQYGDSTKRETDDSVGMLGIGSKSGFAYTDAFTIVSYHKGLKSTYAAVLDQSNIGSLTKLLDEPCQESGLEVLIPVLRQDIKEFQSRAITLFQHFKPKPVINIEIPEPKNIKLKHGFIDHARDSKWVAVMGCVPYRINLDHIKDDLTNLGYYQTLVKMSGGLYFQIGEVEVSANREELKYTDLTKTALIDQLVALFHELLSGLDDPNTSDWDKRLKLRVLEGYRDLPKGLSTYLEGHQDLSIYSASIRNYKTFRLHNSYSITDHISVHPLTRLILKDDPRNIAGWALRPYDHLVRPVNKQTMPHVKTELDNILKQARMEGVPIINISSLPWDATRLPAKATKASDKKHKAKRFMLQPHAPYYQHPWGKYWTIVEREPTESDVYVNLQAFIPTGYGTRFYYLFEQDQASLSGTGFVMPDIYGYKDTQDHPGIRYEVWRKQTLPKVLETDTVKAYLDRWQWARVFGPHLGNISRELREQPKNTLDKVSQNPGSDHPVTGFFSKFVEHYTSIQNSARASIEDLVNSCDPQYLSKSQARKTLDNLLIKYPLFTTLNEGIQVLAGKHPEQWCNYILLVDRK